MVKFTTMGIENGTRVYGITKFGTRLLEGAANGMSVEETGALLRAEVIPHRTLKEYASALHADLGIGGRSGRGRQYRYPLHRGVGMAIVSGLMKSRDLKRGGTPFTFTMQPDESCPIQYRPSYVLIEGEMKPVDGLEQPSIRVKTPEGYALQKISESIVLPPTKRSYLSALLLGMSSVEINNGVSFESRWSMRDTAKEAGLHNSLQLAAHCAVIGAIEVPEEIMVAGTEVTPIIYENSVTVDLPLGVDLSSTPTL